MSYQACFYMEKGICLDEFDIRDCCIGLDCDKRGLPKIISDFKGKTPDWKKVFEIKEKRNKYVQETGVPDICEGCGYLNEGYTFTGERKFSEIMYQNIRICNARCIYCSEEYHSGTQSYNAYPITKDFIKKGFFQESGTVTFQGGEPTIMKNFNDIIKLYLEKNANIRVNSSGIMYSDAIFKGIKSSNLKLVVSIDSGTRDLYYKIKRVDKFDVLVSNLKKYASVINENNKDCLTIKYIILPGINDSIEEIDNWIKLLKDIGIRSIILDLENRYAGQCDVPPDYIFYLEDYIQNYAQKNEISFDLNVFLLWANRKRTIPVYGFENFDKQKFSNFIEEEKKKYLHKNIQYI